VLTNSSSYVQGQLILGARQAAGLCMPQEAACSQSLAAEKKETHMWSQLNTQYKHGL